jgi:prophage regulatory protein
METTSRKILRSNAVTKRTGKSRVQIWRDVKAKKFPAPVDLGPNSIGWFEDEVDAWMASRPRRTYGVEGEAVLEYTVDKVTALYQEQQRQSASSEQTTETRE